MTQNASTEARARGLVPGAAWRWTRRLTQSITFLAIVLGPFLGGWQRLDRAELATWSSVGTDLPMLVMAELPVGGAPAQAHAYNFLKGGGLAADYLSIPMMDPVAGAWALLTGAGSGRALLAWLLPVLLAMFAGRVFCGWFCPYGTIARAVDFVLGFVRWRKGFRVPESRPVRWILLASAILASVFGAHLLLYLSLPHLLVQQSAYAAWLLGGGTALLGVLGGLLFAGVVFGPTIYCSAICPTGAALSFLARKRVVKLNIVSPAACGTSCRLCDQGCWLQLSPRTGDAGPDCDLCARCVAACPRSNLRVGSRFSSKATASLAFLTLLLSAPTAQAAEDGKPEQVLHAERHLDGVTLAVSAVDQTGVQLSADAEHRLYGIELSVYLCRGEIGEPDESGRLPERDIYAGPLTLELLDASGARRSMVHMDAPNYPHSTPQRAIYRNGFALRLETGDRVVVHPVPGWVEEAQSFTVPPPGMDPRPRTILPFALASAFFFLGLFSFALAARRSG